MSRFDLYRVRQLDEYLLDMQSDLLELQGTRMMAPVLPVSKVPERAKLLHPVIEFEGEKLCVVTHLMAAVPKALIRQPIANVSDQADALTRALDILFQGH